MFISEAARRAEVTVKTLRYYESLGLVSPARRANGYRDYGEVDARRAAEVRELGRLGIPAERTRPFLECLAAGHLNADDCPASLAGYRAAIEDLTGRIEALAARRAALAGRLREAAYRAGGTAARSHEDALAGRTRPPAILRVPRDDGAAGQLAGTRVPRIVLPSTAGGTVPLDDLGQGRAIVYFYPLTGRPDVDLPEGWDTIPGARGCTAQAGEFRDHSDDLAAAGAARVLGVSSQDTAYQKEMVERLRLPFPILSDPSLRAARLLGLPTFTAGRTTLYQRLTLVIRDAVIEHVFYPVFAPDQHASQVLQWLRDNPAAA
jgi:peroxiredoxin/DNA-binding transcriptional MerR regulator